MRHIRSIFVLMLALLLAACGGAATGGEQLVPPPATTSAPAQPTTAPEPTAAPKATSVPPAAEPTSATLPHRPGADAATSLPTQGDVLAIYHKSGGIAGIDETLTIYADGRVELKTRAGAKAGQVPAEQLSDLQKLISSPEFAALDARYQAVGADLITYQVTIPAAGRTVVTMDSAPTPPALSQAIAELEQLRTYAK